MKDFYNLILFIVICFVVFLVYKSFSYNPMLIEGMTDGSGNSVAVSSPANGVAGNGQVDSCFT